MILFPKIKQFKDAIKYANWAGVGEVTYRGTVKLHGTNAGVCFKQDGKIVAQSRNRELTLESDNHGFAAFVHGHRECLEKIHDQARDALSIAPGVEVTLFGEWIGPGIQGHVALAHLPAKQFVIFAVAAGDKVLPMGDGKWATDGLPVDHIHPITLALSMECVIDFTLPRQIAAVGDYIADEVEGVERRCPWAALFGVEGIGEGIVWRPVGEHAGNTDLWFKSKGAKHSKSAKKFKPPQPLPGTLGPFVDLACSTERLQQGLEYLREMGHPVSMQSMGIYLKWLAGDITDELADDMVGAGLTWKQVAKHINSRAVAWFKALPWDES